MKKITVQAVGALLVVFGLWGCQDNVQFDERSLAAGEELENESDEIKSEQIETEQIGLEAVDADFVVNIVEEADEIQIEGDIGIDSLDSVSVDVIIDSLKLNDAEIRVTEESVKFILEGSSDLKTEELILSLVPGDNTVRGCELEENTEQVLLSVEDIESIELLSNQSYSVALCTEDESTSTGYRVVGSGMITSAAEVFEVEKCTIDEDNYSVELASEVPIKSEKILVLNQDENEIAEAKVEAESKKLIFSKGDAQGEVSVVFVGYDDSGVAIFNATFDLSTCSEQDDVIEKGIDLPKYIEDIEEPEEEELERASFFSLAALSESYNDLKEKLIDKRVEINKIEEVRRKESDSLKPYKKTLRSFSDRIRDLMDKKMAFMKESQEYKGEGSMDTELLVAKVQSLRTEIKRIQEEIDLQEVMKKDAAKILEVEEGKFSGSKDDLEEAKKKATTFRRGLKKLLEAIRKIKR